MIHLGDTPGTIAASLAIMGSAGTMVAALIVQSWAVFLIGGLLLGTGMVTEMLSRGRHRS